MDYSMEAVANKMILVIVVLSVVIAAVAYFLFVSIDGSDENLLLATILGVGVGEARTSDAIPFATGVLMAMCVNIAKVLLMKRAVDNALKREAVSAKLYLQGQYFARLVIMAGVLFLAGWLHANMQNDVSNPQVVNFMGAFFGVLVFPVATHSMRFFLKDEPGVELKKDSKSTVQTAIDELNQIGEDSGNKEN